MVAYSKYWQLNPTMRLSVTERHLKEKKERIAREREAQESGEEDF